MKLLRFLGNVIWFCTFGLVMYISEIIAAVISCITIIPIFFGIPWVHLNNAKFFVAPFGKRVETHFATAPIRNIISFIFGGFINGLMLLFIGVFSVLQLSVFQLAKSYLAQQN